MSSGARSRRTTTSTSLDADGKNRRQITDPKPPFQDARAQLSPDGSAIVLNRQDGKTIAI